MLADDPSLDARVAGPVHQPLRVVGELVRLRSRTMEGRGEILLSDGTVAASAEAKYIRLPDPAEFEQYQRAAK